jgi:hypothetical protein
LTRAMEFSNHPKLLSLVIRMRLVSENPRKRSRPTSADPTAATLVTILMARRSGAERLPGSHLLEGAHPDAREIRPTRPSSRRSQSAARFAHLSFFETPDEATGGEQRK